MALLKYVRFFLLIVTLAGCSDNGQQIISEPSQQEERVTDALPVDVTSISPTSDLAELVLMGGQLISMSEDEPDLSEIKGLVIRDGKIDRIILADSSEALPPAAQTIDASSFYIIPGLIDSHTHFRTWTPAATIWRRGALYFGVTGLVDFSPCGANCKVENPNEWIVAYKNLLNNSAQSNGPTLYITGMKLHAPDNKPEAHAHNLQSLDEIGPYIDYLAGLGVDAIITGEELPVEYRQKIIEEGNRHGLPVLGGSRDAQESVSLGQKFIEHMHPVVYSLASNRGDIDLLSSPEYDHLMDLDLAPSLVQLMVENNVFLNPTMVSRYVVLSERAESYGQEAASLFEFGQVFSDFPIENRPRILAGYQLNEKMDPATLQNQQDGFSKIQQFLRMYSEAGGKIVVGPDTTDGRLPGLTVHQEMEMLVDAGISPYRALLGATRWASEMLNDSNVGSVEQNKQADIVILGGNPLEAISNSRDIKYVIRKGRVVRSPQDCSVIEPPIKPTCW